MAKLDLSAFDTATPAPAGLDLSAFDEPAKGPSPAPAPGGLDLSAFDAETQPTQPASGGADIEELAKRGTTVSLGLPIKAPISKQDLDYIAAKHGVPVDFLRESTGWLAGVLDPRERRGIEHVTESLKSTAGAAAEGLLFGLPQKLWNKFVVDDDAKRRAVDDLRKLIDERKSAGQMTGETALGFATGQLALDKLAKAGTATARALGVAEATGMGAAAGYAHSGEDDELASTLVGGVLGLGLSGAPAAVGFVRSRFSKHAPEEVVRVATEAAEDSVARAKSNFAEAADAEAELARVVLGSPQVREAARSKDVYQFLDTAPPETITKLAQLADESTPGVSRRVQQAIGEDAARAWGVVREAVTEFDGRVGVGARRGGVRDIIEQEGMEEVAARFRGMREARYLNRVIDAIPEQEIGKPAAIRKFAAWYSDARHTLDSIDRRVGTRLVPTIDRLSGAYNKFRGDMVWASSLQRGLNRLLLRAEKQPTKAGDRFDLYAALDRKGSEKSSRYTPEQRRAIEAWRGGFEELRRKANELGIPVQKFDGGYVPHMVVDPAEFVRRMEVAGERLGLRLNQTAKSTYVGLDDAGIEAVLRRAEAGEKLAEEFVQGLTMARGGTVRSLTEAREALNGMLDLSRVGHALETRAGVSMAREGSIPLWLRERDPSRLFQRWAHGTFRHARMRRGLDELRTVAEAVQDKSPEASGYITRLIHDLVGVREGSAAAAQGEFGRRIQMNLWRAARRAGEYTATGKMYLQLAKLPDAISFFSSQLYAYGLGMRVDKFLENLTQPLTLTIPSIGIRNGGYVMRGAADMLVHFGKGLRRGEPSLKEFLESKGLNPPDQPFESSRWLREGLERSPLRRAGQAVLEGSSRAAMLLYQQSDIMTRGITYHAARRVAEDVMSGKLAGRNLEIILEEMGSGYRNLIREKLERGEDITQTVAEWMNAHTMFNYNRVSMSEYGRFMGSLFSTFSKWPTSIIGDLASRVDRVSRGDARLGPEMMRTGVKYLVPWLVLKGLHGAVSEELDESPMAQMIVGKDLSKPAPIRSATGGLISAPLPRAVTEVGVKLIEDDPAAAGAAALRNMLPFTPGGVWIRMLYKDFPMWRGEQPDRGNPLELLLRDTGISEED